MDNKNAPSSPLVADSEYSMARHDDMLNVRVDKQGTLFLRVPSFAKHIKGFLMGGGAYLLKEGFDRYAQAQLGIDHAERRAGEE